MLEIKNLKKSYLLPDGEDLPILDFPRWAVDAGEQVVVMGASGCGKTTLLHIIAGILRPTSGHVLIDGWDTPILTEAERDQFRARRIGYVFQTFNLLPRTTALRNVEMPMLYAGVSRAKRMARAKELLELMEMGDRAGHMPNELSGGQKQRVAIARAMANDPSIILADEPTGALDVATGRLVMDIFEQLNKEQGKTIVLITHNHELAERTQRIIRLSDGNITGEEVLAR